MDGKPLEDMIRAMRERVEALTRGHEEVAPPGLTSNEILVELEAALEELRVAGEELHEQNEQLISSRQEVEEERRRYRELFELAPDAYLLTDASGLIREANRTAAQLLGVRHGSLHGKPLILYVALEERREFSSRLTSLAQGNALEEWDVRLQPRKGRQVIAAVSVTTAQDAPGHTTGFRWLLHDVTEQRRAQAEIGHYVNRLEVLRHMDQAMLNATSLKHTAEIALDYLRRLVPFRRTSVALIDPQKGEMTIVAVLVDGETGIPEGAVTRFDPSESTMSPTQWRVVEDTHALQNPSPWLRTMRDEGVRTIMNAPLVVQGEIVGSLNLGLESPDQFGRDDREVVQEVADRLAVAIQQARLLDQVRTYAAELERRVAERTAELQRSEERLRLVLRQLPAIVWTTDRDLIISSASGSGLSNVRLSGERLIGRNLRSYQRLARTPLAAIDVHERALQGERVAYEAEFRGRAYQSRVEPFTDSEGAIVGCLGVAVDVTSLKHTEQALRETTDRLETINRRLLAFNAIELGAQELLEVDDIIALVVRQIASLDLQAAILLREKGQPSLRGTSLESRVVARVEAILGVPRMGPMGPEGARAWPVQSEARETVWVPDALPLLAEMMPTVPRQALARAARIVGLRSAIVSPLIARGANIGLFVLWGNGLSDSDIPATAMFANQLAVAIDNAALFGAIRRQRERLRTLTARLAELEEADRRVMARELHDQVGQNLSALSLSISTLWEQIRDLPEEEAAPLRQRIDDALALVRETAARARDIMGDLRPPVLDDYGLMAALRWQAEGLGRRTSLAISVRGKEPEPRLPSPVEIALFRIAQEALINVAMHAGTDQAWVTIEEDEDRVRLVVADAGIGFEPSEEASAEGRSGWGLITIEERAEAVGGRSHVESQPGRGTRVTVEVPR